MSDHSTDPSLNGEASKEYEYNQSANSKVYRGILNHIETTPMDEKIRRMVIAKFKLLYEHDAIILNQWINPILRRLKMEVELIKATMEMTEMQKIVADAYIGTTSICYANQLEFAIMETSNK